MNLKCIGGELDQTTAYVDCNYYRVGDMVRLPKPLKYRLLDFKEELRALRRNKVPSHITQQYFHYRLACFNFNKDDRYLFLIKDGWTDKEAILYQFSR